jgi:SAM-dependent methyltransferase
MRSTRAFIVTSVKKIIRDATRFVLKNKRIRPMVLSVLAEWDPLKDYNSFGTFTDSGGNTFRLLVGLRDDIWPNWQELVARQTFLDVPADEKLVELVRNARAAVQALSKFLRKFSIELQGKQVLEIGCYNGAKTYALAEIGASSVTGSDLPFYYCEPEGVSGSEGARRMALLRKVMRERFHLDESDAKRVQFVDDDICISNLPSESFDIIVSWDVLEHISNPKAALENIYRLLKPGAVAFHLCHPFFCLTGGHGFCTLDFPWGHVRLSSEDFVRYLKQWRPQEAQKAERYYHNSLNRLTFRDLEGYCCSAGFEMIALIPFWESKHLEMVNSNILAESVRMYPSLTINDLIMRNYRLLIRKPGKKTDKNS